MTAGLHPIINNPTSQETTFGLCYEPLSQLYRIKQNATFIAPAIP